jgi:predicted metalloprotease
MRIEDQSSNVEDRRGMSRGGRGIVGGGIGMIILVVVGMFFGIDPRVILGLAGTVQTVQQQVAPQKVEGAKGPLSDDMGRFVAGVLADTEKTWDTVFQQLGRLYQHPTLVLFTGATPTACGTGQAAMGPFYCPLDQSVYIDLAFYQQLREYNALSVRLELQADCFAGVWAHHAGNRNLLEAGDVEEAMRAASAIGDDTIQRRTQGRIVPDSFTHGSSEQRMRWFMTGMKSGQIAACNTFEGNQI